MAKPATGRAGVAPSIAPLPDMQLCRQCEELHAGYYRESGEFVCCECWGNYMAAGLVTPKGEPAAPAQGVADALATLSRGLQAVVERRVG